MISQLWIIVKVFSKFLNLFVNSDKYQQKLSRQLSYIDYCFFANIRVSPTSRSDKKLQ